MSRLLDFSRLFGVAVGAAYHVVAALVTWFTPLPGGMAAAAAIIMFTAAVRLALLPLSYLALRGEGPRTRLLARMQDVRRRYAGQPDRLQAELARLYQAEGSGLFAGCLPLLLQLPFFSVMYRLFVTRTVGGAPNTLLRHRLLEAPLGAHWLSGAGPFSHQGVVFAGLFALLGVVGWIGLRMGVRAAGPAAAPPGRVAGGHAENRGARRAGKLTASGTPNRASGDAGQMSAAGGAAGLAGRLLPYVTVAVAAIVPLAAGVYLLATTAWTALERAALRRRVAAPDRAQPVRGRQGRGPNA